MIAASKSEYRRLSAMGAPVTQTLEYLINRVLGKHDITNDEYHALVYLRPHTGKTNAILRSDLASMMGVDVRKVRAIVKSLIEKHGVTIAASQTGYYIINTEHERQVAKADLLSRARSLQHRALVLDTIRFSA